MTRQNPIYDAIEQVLQIYDDESEDFVLMEESRQLLRRLREVAEEFESFKCYARKKRMGRHSSSTVRKNERIADFRCYELVERIRSQEGVSLNTAAEKVGKQLNKGFETVKKAHKRARTLLSSYAYRLSPSDMKPDA